MPQTEARPGRAQGQTQTKASPPPCQPLPHLPPADILTPYPEMLGALVQRATPGTYAAIGEQRRGKRSGELGTRYLYLAPKDQIVDIAQIAIDRQRAGELGKLYLTASPLSRRALRGNPKIYQAAIEHGGEPAYFASKNGTTGTLLWLVLDLDYGHDPTPPHTTAEARQTIHEGELSGKLPPAEYVVTTGRGLQLYFRPKRPPTKREFRSAHTAIRAAFSEYAAWLKPDANASRPCNWYALPGSAKAGHTVTVYRRVLPPPPLDTQSWARAASQTPKPTRQTRRPTPKPAHTRRHARPDVPPSRPRRGGRPSAPQTLAIDNLERLINARGGTPQGERNTQTHCMAGIYRTLNFLMTDRQLDLDERNNQANQQTLASMMIYNAAFNCPPLPPAEIEQIVGNVNRNTHYDGGHYKNLRSTAALIAAFHPTRKEIKRLNLQIFTPQITAAAKQAARERNERRRQETDDLLRQAYTTGEIIAALPEHFAASSTRTAQEYIRRRRRKLETETETEPTAGESAAASHLPWTRTGHQHAARRHDTPRRRATQPPPTPPPPTPPPTPPPDAAARGAPERRDNRPASIRALDAEIEARCPLGGPPPWQQHTK